MSAIRTKIVLFQKEYGKDFIAYKHLDDEEATKVRKELIEKFEIYEPNDILEWLETIKAYSSDWDASNEFDLLAFLGSVEIHAQESVYINWYQFDDIDCLKLVDLADYFDGLWFPGSDDIEIFDDSMDWIVSVRHDGVLSVCKAGSLK